MMQNARQKNSSTDSRWKGEDSQWKRVLNVVFRCRIAKVGGFGYIHVKMDIQRTEDKRTRKDVEFYKIDFG